MTASAAPTGLRRTRLRAAAGLAAAAVLLACASALLEPFSSVQPSPQALERLRRTAVRIKADFQSLLDGQGARLSRLTAHPWPDDPTARFGLLRDAAGDPQIEGAALTGPEGDLLLWLGHAFDVGDIVSAAPPAAAPVSGRPIIRLVRAKSSSYLVQAARVDRGFAVVFRLLAFSPEFKSRFLAEYQFLPARLRSGGRIEYIDFRDDASRYEDLFRRGGDEFIGRPGLEGRIQSLFFPLRDPGGRMAATVNIRSKAPAAVLRSRIEALWLAALILAFLALSLILWDVLASGRRPLAAALTLTGLRLALLPLGRLSVFEGSAAFSPAGAGFRSILGLTGSPFDIFATSVWLAALLALAARIAAARPDSAAGGRARAASRWPTAGAFIASCAGISALMGAAVRHILRNASLNPLEFRARPDFLFLFAGLILVWGAGTALQAALLRRLAPRPPFWIVGPALLLPPLLGAAISPASWVTGLAAGPALTALIVALRQGVPARLRRWGIVAVLLQTVFFYVCLAGAASEKGRTLAGRFVKDSVESLEPWARFLLTESIPEVDRSKKAIIGLLGSAAADSTLAAEIWSRTLPARFNWYSSLEILGRDGVPRSRFSLNIPKILRPAAAASPGADWTVAAVAVPLMGRERRFLTAARDLIEEGEVLGRVVLSLSLDPDMLPFLYSSNPYFELLRVDTIPSLSGFDIRFAVFDAQGRILFNPFKISSGVAASAFAPEGKWSRWRDNGRPYDLYGFLAGDRRYAAFLPRRTWRFHVVNLARTIALALAGLGPLLAATAWASARRRGRRFLWSFASRVFLSFLTVALVPILLFAAFSSSFFDRLFTRQFVEKAALHADMARGVMDDFLFLEEGAAAGIDWPPEDLVLWISNTIGNDVNLYRDGRLVASSRRELFDAGILPEILDGDVYFQLRYGSDPTVASETRLGTYSLRTLTVPYESPGGSLAIGLPFPFERRDIASASQELTEFLVFMAVFILGLVPLAARGIGGRIVEPVRRLLAGTREASLGNLEFAIDYEGRDEMKTLVDGFNAMIGSLKQHQQELAELGQKAAWAEMARKVAHEIKNPLTPIQLSAEHILRVYEDGRQDLGPALKESISYIVGEVDNLRRIALEFLDVSREPVARRERIPVDDLFRETVEPYRRLLADRIDIHEEYSVGRPAVVLGDRAKLKVALRNLLTNAIESIHGRGEIRTRVEAAGSEILMAVDDTGTGMEADVRDRIFEPYFSTKDAGTGLGLPISKKIVEDHGGSIRIESAPGRGTRVLISLPAAPAADDPPAAA